MTPLVSALIPVGWLALVIVVSIGYRRAKGKPIVPHAPSHAAYVERWTSGRSLGSVFSRIGGASNCLLVFVADGELTVVPQFPFTLMFLPEFYGLELTAPAERIERIETRRRLFRAVTRLSFRDGAPAPMELQIDDTDAFERALGRRGAGSTGAIDTRPRRRRLRFFPIFAVGFALLWGSIGFYFGATGLATDHRFASHGIPITGTVEASGSRADPPTIVYRINGERYRIDSLRGEGMVAPGQRIALRYLPGAPVDAREDGYFWFDLLWLILGTIALAFGLGGFALRLRRALIQD